MKIDMSKNIRQVKLVHSVSQYVEIHCFMYICVYIYIYILIDLFLSNMFYYFKVKKNLKTNLKAQRCTNLGKHYGKNSLFDQNENLRNGFNMIN